MKSWYTLLVVILALTGCQDEVPGQALGTLERDRITLTATAGTAYALLASAAGPDERGAWPVVADPWTGAGLTNGALFAGYLGLVPPGGVATMQLRLPAVSLTRGMTLYHAAVTATAGPSNVARVVVRP